MSATFRYLCGNHVIISTFQLCEYYYLFGNENSRGTLLKLREGKQPNGSQLSKNLRGPWIMIPPRERNPVKLVRLCTQLFPFRNVSLRSPSTPFPVVFRKLDHGLSSDEDSKSWSVDHGAVGDCVSSYRDGTGGCVKISVLFFFHIWSQIVKDS